jgi:hypothetical protein
VYYLGANVPVAALTKLCHEVEPDLTIVSFPLAFPETTAAQIIRALAQEVSPASHLTVGGHGALAMREHFLKSHIDVLEDFAGLDEKLEQLTRRSTVQG